MTFQVGDIVTVRGRTGRWVVMGRGLYASAIWKQWRLRQENYPGHPIGHTAGEGDITLLARPSLVPGMKLKHNGLTVTVAADGAETVRVAIDAADRRHPLFANPISGRTVTLAFGPGASDVDRGALVSENVSILIEGALP